MVNICEPPNLDKSCEGIWPNDPIKGLLRLHQQTDPEEWAFICIPSCTIWPPDGDSGMAHALSPPPSPSNNGDLPLSPEGQPHSLPPTFPYVKASPHTCTHSYSCQIRYVALGFEVHPTGGSTRNRLEWMEDLKGCVRKRGRLSAGVCVYWTGLLFLHIRCVVRGVGWCSPYSVSVFYYSFDLSFVCYVYFGRNIYCGVLYVLVLFNKSMYLSNTMKPNRVFNVWRLLIHLPKNWNQISERCVQQYIGLATKLWCDVFLISRIISTAYDQVKVCCHIHLASRKVFY